MGRHSGFRTLAKAVPEKARGTRRLDGWDKGSAALAEKDDAKVPLRQSGSMWKGDISEAAQGQKVRRQRRRRIPSLPYAKRSIHRLELSQAPLLHGHTHWEYKERDVNTSNTQAASANIRLRWNYRPDSDLYLIYTAGQQFASLTAANPAQFTQNRFAVKYTYSWRP